MNDFFNWDKIFLQSDDFHSKPKCKFTFIEDLISKEFYDRLVNEYPQSDDKEWISVESVDKSSFRQFFNSKEEIIEEGDPDPKFSDTWNDFYLYLNSPEVIKKIRDFSGVNVTKLKHFSFMLLKQGGYQQPHIHNVGPSTIIFILYFNKNWSSGDPGGTYISTQEDETKIDFEPQNLDNSGVIFHDGPFAGHGVKYIEKDISRKAIQLYYEEFSVENGWSGDKNIKPEPIEL